MSLWRSPADGFAKVGWRGLGLALALVWLAPAAFGAVSLAVQWLIGSRDWGGLARPFWLGSLLLALSPAISWLALVLAAPVSVRLLRTGWFGYGSCLVLGLALGALTAYLTRQPVGIGFGVAQLLALRAILGRLQSGLPLI